MPQTWTDFKKPGGVTMMSFISVSFIACATVPNCFLPRFYASPSTRQTDDWDDASQSSSCLCLTYHTCSVCIIGQLITPRSPSRLQTRPPCRR